jgi:integrase
MEYLDKGELTRLLQTVYNTNATHHLAFVTALWHGLRVSELAALRGSDVADSKVNVRRLKGSHSSVQPIYFDDDPVFDGSPIIELAKMRGPDRLFPYSRQYFDKLIKMYGIRAGIHPSKAHMHVLKHSLAMLLWDESKSLGEIQSLLGHVAPSSTLAYLRVIDEHKAQDSRNRIKIRRL